MKKQIIIDIHQDGRVTVLSPKEFPITRISAIVSAVYQIGYVKRLAREAAKKTKKGTK